MELKLAREEDDDLVESVTVLPLRLKNDDANMAPFKCCGKVLGVMWHFK